MTSTFLSNLHMHTIYGDGKNTPEEMIQAALNKGFISAGISEHAFAEYDTSYCIAREKIHAYRDEMQILAKRYAGRMEVHTGLEVDYFCLHDKSGWDYIIGSIHYVRGEESGRYYALDYLPEVFEQAIEDVGRGDVRVLVEKYCAQLSDLALGYRPDILGHIDIISKINKGNRYFDPDAGWYLALWEEACGHIAESGCIVELNTGAMSRGYTDKPYPHRNILRILHSLSVPVTISSDAHEASAIDHAFPECVALLRETGYSSVKMMRAGRFVDVPL